MSALAGQSRDGLRRALGVAAVLAVCSVTPALAEDPATVADESAGAVQPASSSEPATDDVTPGDAADSAKPEPAALPSTDLSLSDTDLEFLLDPCKQMDDDYESWLDSGQVVIYRSVCGAAAWFDSFFGSYRFDRETGNTFGRVGLGVYWDERDGLDEKLRFRARFALPGLRQRGNILIGRGNEDQLIEEIDTTQASDLPRFPQIGEDGEDSLFAAFGYRRQKNSKRAFGFDVGVKFRTPIEPFVKATYTRTVQVSERNLLQFRPIVYWRDQEGFGSTVTVDWDFIINNSWLYRWRNYGNVSEDKEVQGLDFGSTMSLFQALSRKRGLTYSIFYQGETKADVERKNMGWNIRYRQRILREWLFIEFIGGTSWPRYAIEEKREPNWGGGILLEAYFGPAPDNYMR